MQSAVPAVRDNNVVKLVEDVVMAYPHIVVRVTRAPRRALERSR